MLPNAVFGRDWLSAVRRSEMLAFSNLPWGVRKPPPNDWPYERGAWGRLVLARLIDVMSLEVIDVVNDLSLEGVRDAMLRLLIGFTFPGITQAFRIALACGMRRL